MNSQVFQKDIGIIFQTSLRILEKMKIGCYHIVETEGKIRAKKKRYLLSSIEIEISFCSNDFETEVIIETATAFKALSDELCNELELEILNELKEELAKYDPIFRPDFFK